jgi:hypothetical protein
MFVTDVLHVHANTDNRWKQILKGDSVSWLLEPDNPSVRYFTLVKLLGRPASDPEVAAVQAAIMDSPLVQLIKRKQRPDGRWGARNRAYGHTVWRLLLLSLLGTQPEESIRKGCDYLLSHGSLSEGGFSYNGLPSGYLPCYTANALFLLCRFGYANDVRVQAAISYLVHTQLDEGGWLCSKPTRKTHSCLWGTAKVLRAFACLPRPLKTSKVAVAEKAAIDLFLTCGLYKSNEHDFGPPHPHWFMFGFPLLMESDVLEVLSLVAPFVSADDPRIQEGLELVLSKQDDTGRWPLEKNLFVHRNGTIAWQLTDASTLISLRERFGSEEFGVLGRIGQPSKWVTLDVLTMFKQLYNK